MKVRRGFLLAYDAALRKMIPFFVKVRSRDIIPDNPIAIDAVLVKTSERWHLDRMEDSVDVTVYKYTANWTSKTDPNSETVGTDKCEGNIQYRLYKDGRMEVYGSLILSETTVQMLQSNNIAQHRYDIYLPFAFPEDNVQICASWMYGGLAETSIGAKVEKVAISNLTLNPELSNGTTYPSLLRIYAVESLASAVQTQQYVFELQNTGGSISNYMTSNFPVTFKYDGWWKPISDIEVINAESYDGVISGAYKTTGMVNLLSKPDSVEGEIIRPLQGGSVVRNYGYYTERNGIRWFLMIYPSTNERGYIPESSLKKGI